MSFWTHRPFKSTPQDSEDTQICLWGISRNVNLKHIMGFSYHHVIPTILYEDIMHYFDKVIHVYG